MSCEIWIKFTFNDLMTLKSGSICVFVKGLELTIILSIKHQKTVTTGRHNFQEVIRLIDPKSFGFGLLNRSPQVFLQSWRVGCWFRLSATIQLSSLALVFPGFIHSCSESRRCCSLIGRLDVSTVWILVLPGSLPVGSCAVGQRRYSFSDFLYC